MSKTSIVVIVGPTGIGKSELAVAIGKRWNGEVVSADSMQVYRGMDIGTAKLTVDEMQGVRHHLIDVIEPTQTCTAALWKTWADEAIAEIAGRGRLPVVCGGTGLYIRGLTDDLDFSTGSSESPARAHWRAFLAEHGNTALYAALVERDPARASQLHPNDTKRVLRALEVHDTAERPMSANYDWSTREGRYRVLMLGLCMEREVLYRRVDDRVDTMWKAGLVEEVAALRRAGVTGEHTCLQAIGYKEVVDLLDHRLTEEQAIDTIKRNTRRFVKRQMSWFARDPRIHWFAKTSDGRFADGEEQRM